MPSAMSLIPLAAIAFGATLLSAQQPVPQPAQQPPPQIITTATGEATVVPDRATIIFTVETRANTAAAAGSDNASRQRAVLDALRAAGVANEDLSTIGYTLNPEMRHDGKEPRVTGYVARNSVRVNVKRIEQVGALIDAALGKGANNVSSLRYFSSRADDIRRTALAAAVAKARADAEAMARAAGGTLGGLLEVQSVGDVIVPMERVMVTAAAADRSAFETPINPGEQTITASVQTRWLFLPGAR